MGTNNFLDKNHIVKIWDRKNGNLPNKMTFSGEMSEFVAFFTSVTKENTIIVTKS